MIQTSGWKYAAFSSGPPVEMVHLGQEILWATRAPNAEGLLASVKVGVWLQSFLVNSRAT